MLWVGIFAGPFAWALDEVLGYTATAHDCSTGNMLFLHSLTIGALVLCGIGVLCSRKAQTDISTADAPSGTFERGLSMATAGITLSAGFAVVIIATALPKWVLSPCY